MRKIFIIQHNLKSTYNRKMKQVTVFRPLVIPYNGYEHGSWWGSTLNYMYRGKIVGVEANCCVLHICAKIFIYPRQEIYGAVPNLLQYRCCILPGSQLNHTCTRFERLHRTRTRYLSCPQFNLKLRH